MGALTIDPGNSNTLYLGLGDPFDGTGIGMMKSTDAGTTWTGPVYLGGATVINDIKVAPGGSVILAATNIGVYRSTNAGATWTAVTLATGQTASPYAWSIGWTGGTNFVVSVEANKAATTGTTDGQIHRTTDNGQRCDMDQLYRLYCHGWLGSHIVRRRRKHPLQPQHCSVVCPSGRPQCHHSD